MSDDYPELKFDMMANYTLALLFFSSFRENDKHPWRAWKGHDWDIMNYLHDKGYISNPKSKAKSIVFTDEGFEHAKKLFYEYFGK